MKHPFFINSHLVDDFGVAGASENAHIRQVCCATSKTPAPKNRLTRWLLNIKASMTPHEAI